MFPSCPDHRKCRVEQNWGVRMKETVSMAAKRDAKKGIEHLREVSGESKKVEERIPKPPRLSTHMR